MFVIGTAIAIFLAGLWTGLLRFKREEDKDIMKDVNTMERDELEQELKANAGVIYDDKRLGRESIPDLRKELLVQRDLWLRDPSTMPAFLAGATSTGGPTPVVTSTVTVPDFPVLPPNCSVQWAKQLMQQAGFRDTRKLKEDSDEPKGNVLRFERDELVPTRGIIVYSGGPKRDHSLLRKIIGNFDDFNRTLSS